MTHVMRGPCPKCGCTDGRIETRNNQDCVFCAGCNRHCYNAPKTETGRAVRSVSTTRNGIKPQQRARILLRANCHCELCGGLRDLHLGHLVSVKDGMARGMTEAEINDDENLAAMCDECNLGVGSETVSLRLAIAMVLIRIKNRQIRGEAS